MSISDRWRHSATRWRLGNGRVHASNAWYRVAGRRIQGTRQQYRNWLNARAHARGKDPLPDRVTRAVASRTPVYRNQVNPATGRPRRDDAARIRRADRKTYDRISTQSLERMRDHDASRGLHSSREHCEFILADRARRASRVRSR